jgi:hypothetical protein
MANAVATNDRNTKGNTMSTNYEIAKGIRKDTPIAHAPVRVTIPSTMSETAFLRRLARKGATIITKNGERYAVTGHAVAMRNIDGAVVSPLFAPRVNGGKRYADNSAKAQLD